MIPFKTPQLSMTLAQYMEVVQLQSKAGSCIAFLIGLGGNFFTSGIIEVDNILIPMLLKAAPSNVTLRVIPSYSMLLWFTIEILKEAGLEAAHREGLVDFMVRLWLLNYKLQLPQTQSCKFLQISKFWMSLARNLLNVFLRSPKNRFYLSCNQQLSINRRERLVSKWKGCRNLQELSDICYKAG